MFPRDAIDQVWSIGQDSSQIFVFLRPEIGPEAAIFEYMRVEEGSAIIIDAENMEVTEIGVNGCPGHLYISVDPEQSNCITWYDNGAKMQFIIDGFLEGNELQKMAASVLQVD